MSFIVICFAYLFFPHSPFLSLCSFRLNNVATPAAWLALSPGDRAKALSEMKNHRARKERVSQKDRDTLQAAT